jgi:hypothetical protein
LNTLSSLVVVVVDTVEQTALVVLVELVVFVHLLLEKVLVAVLLRNHL